MNVESMSEARMPNEPSSPEGITYALRIDIPRMNPLAITKLYG